MSKYDKTIALSHEEEGTYHRREVDYSPSRHHSKPVTTYHTERYLVEDDRKSSPSRALARSGNYTSDEDDKDNFEEWTTSKRKVNHKTRQVETRVSRQLLVENGKVIADSGPQVTTRIKEDNKVEECEKEKTPKNKSKFEALENAPEGPEGSSSGRVLGEKKEIQRVSREVREENMQYHDERFKELTGRDVHQRAIKAPHELITINDKHHAPESAPRGKMVHYSNRGKKYQDTDEILEVAKLAIDGSVTKEVKRTHNHEEFSEDEKPDETGEADELRHKPVVQRSSRRHVDYVNDYDDVRTPEASDNDEREEYNSHGGQRVAAHRAKKLHSSSRPHGASSGGRHGHEDSDEAFPRYDLDPLLNSLRDEDYKSAPARVHSPPGSQRVKEVSTRRRSGSVSSSDLEQEASQRRGRAHQRHRSPVGSMASGTGGNRVEIPEVYRVNKQRLLAGKSSSRERSYSPQQQQQQQHKAATTTHKSSHRDHGRQSSSRRREDAATQAHLTDEEIERHSLRSSLSGAGAGQQAKATQHLQRQSTPNASRRYYYGTSKKQEGRRRGSVTSSASSISSLEDPKVRARQQGARSRDSGFRSPNEPTGRETPELKKKNKNTEQIYSVSSKSARAREESGAKSPTLTTGSAGQRSVKTTTTTVSAGLQERPGSRQSQVARSESAQGRSSRQEKVSSKERPATPFEKLAKFFTPTKNKPRQQQQVAPASRPTEASESEHQTQDEREDEFLHLVEGRGQEGRPRSLDTISVSSLQGPNATKIKVPYRHVIEIQRSEQPSPRREVVDSFKRRQRAPADEAPLVVSAVPQRGRPNGSTGGSEMSLQEDIESLSKRLASISRDAGALPNQDQERKRFDYKTVVATVAQSAPAHHSRQVVDAYNVRLEQNSPFQQQQQQQQPDRSGAREGATTTVKGDNNQATIDNNNESNFDLSDFYVKYRATPALVDESSLLTGKRLDGDDQQARARRTRRDKMGDDEEEDRMSQVSSDSLQSSRTYKVRTIGQQAAPSTQDDGEAQSQDQQRVERHENDEDEPEFDENGNSKRPSAWIFDPRDGSSTAIVPPARPKRPETPKVDSKTEELVQSRGGRSYYLELVEPTGKATKRPRPSSIDSHLYSRWTSQGALNLTQASQQQQQQQLAPASSSHQNSKPLSAIQLQKSTLPQYKSTKQINSTIAQQQQDRMKTNNNQRRQLPFGGLPATLGDKSKSSSCLLTVTKPSKYSIYGGFRKPGETNKPVPRLSYSRAIGPRSQRIDGQPKPMPSRYLKMR